jgi:putative membrane protein
VDIRADLPFMQEAASANLMEIQLGQLAQQKGVTPAVKQFGQRMVSDHSSLQSQLTTTASQNGVSFTPTLSATHKQEISRLQGITALQFDRAYMRAMIFDHQNDVAKFQSESGAAHSAPVQNLIANSLPILQQHLTLAQQVGSQLGVEVAATPTQPTPTQPTNVPPQNGQVVTPVAQSDQAAVKRDREFINEVAQDNILEARLGQLAENRAQNSAVRQFAQREDADHTRLQGQWNTMTTSSGLPVQQNLGKKHRKKLDQLTKLSGRAFDRAFMSLMVQDHKDYIDYFEKEGRASNSSQVRTLVDQTLPVLMRHFNDAKRVGAQVGADTDVTLRSERSKK